MTNWTNDPPEATDFAAVRLIRPPATGSITGVLTSPTVLGTWTHWDQYRTQPCSGDKCKLCIDGQPRRWYGYISVFSMSTHRHYVVQITSQAAQQLYAQVRDKDNLRGLLIKIERAAKRPNAKLLIDVRPCPCTVPDLPDPIPIQRYMALIWDDPKAAERAAATNKRKNAHQNAQEPN